MHYRNGREAKDGDMVVELAGGKIVAFGVLYGAPLGDNEHYGKIAVIRQAYDYASIGDCFHVEDVVKVLAEKGLDKRPEGR